MRPPIALQGARIFDHHSSAAMSAAKPGAHIWKANNSLPTKRAVACAAPMCALPPGVQQEMFVLRAVRSEEVEEQDEYDTFNMFLQTSPRQAPVAAHVPN